MEKNCTNCKYNIEVFGADYGFCNNEDHLGRISSEYTYCSSYEAAEILNVSELEFDEVIQALTCCTDHHYGCAECPFNRYKHTCQHDLMIAALETLRSK